jgi:hypothetical protein
MTVWIPAAIDIEFTDEMGRRWDSLRLGAHDVRVSFHATGQAHAFRLRPILAVQGADEGRQLINQKSPAQEFLRGPAGHERQNLLEKT